MPTPKQRRGIRITVGSVLAGGAVAAGILVPSALTNTAGAVQDNSNVTTTPIKHVVVLFDENVSFDHYFATYPNAANKPGEKPFTAAADTPTDINTLAKAPGNLLTNNPNQYQPNRLAPDQAVTCSQNHNDAPEQKAVNNGAMDKFVENTNATCTAAGTFSDPGLVMDYYDGNTVAAEWNYAQNYTMSDNNWDTTFGPSTVGALNLVSGQTGGFQATCPLGPDAKQPAEATIQLKDVTGAASGDPYTVPACTQGSYDAPMDTQDPGYTIPDDPQKTGQGTINADPDPFYDDCNNNSRTGGLNKVARALDGQQNVGDLLNAKGVTWGWFQGGFAPTVAWDGNPADNAICGAASTNIVGNTGVNGNGQQVSIDYDAHHSPFEYYKSTSNPHHLPPASVAEIGHDGQANHNYDLSYFYDALNSGNLPAVSYVKAKQVEDGHPGYSDPIDEQHFLVRTINAIEASPDWKNTAIVITYDDSDGWYDHAKPTIINGSNVAVSASANSIDSTICSTAQTAAAPLNGETERCGPSQRIPLLVISPYAKKNVVEHSLTTQVSVLQFIEDNWSTSKIGNGSFDADATTDNLAGFFDFAHPQQQNLLLNSDGTVARRSPVSVPTVSTTTRLTASPASQVYGGTPATLTATVTGGTAAAAGTVTFRDGTKSLGTGTISGGKATVKLPATLAVGTHHLTASYAPTSPTFSAPSTSAALTFVVARSASRTTLSAAPKSQVYGGRPATLTATVTGGATPAGKVTFKDGTKSLGTGTLLHGRATLRLPRTLAVGTHHLTASYAPSNSAVSTSSTSPAVSFTVAKAASKTAVKVKDRTLTTTQRPSVSVTVSATGVAPTGSVRILVDGHTAATKKLSHGKASATLKALKAGRHTVTASYPGSATVKAGRSGKVTVTVTAPKKKPVKKHRH